MTPWHFKLAVKAHNKRRAEEHNRAAFFMWHKEALARHKKMPPLKNYLFETLTEEEPEVKKAVKNIDDNAIIGRLKGYKAERKKIIKEGKA